MIKFSVNDLRETSMVDLEAIQKTINNELTRRKNEKREHLITVFHKAWGELKDAGIRVTYTEEYDDDTAYLDNWDGFSFD